MSVMNEFHAALSQLITLNQKHRADILAMDPGIMTGMSKTAWAREFCTVHCSIGRRTGKTEFIQRVATKDSVIVLSSALHRQSFNDATQRREFLTPEMLRGYESLNVDLVFVDEPRLVFNKLPRESLYWAFRGSDATFVLLGE